MSVDNPHASIEWGTANAEIEQLRAALFKAGMEAGRLYAEIERLRRTLQAIANTERHERDGQDITADTMRRFARAAIAKTERT